MFDDGYKFDGLAEFVSRRARVKLVEMLIDAGFSPEYIASVIGVTSRSVRRWLDPKETHPCNRNLDRLLELAWETNPHRTFELLRDELGLFAELLSQANVEKGPTLAKPAAISENAF
jgi:predicted transcriptional regulator